MSPQYKRSIALAVVFIILVLVFLLRSVHPRQPQGDEILPEGGHYNHGARLNPANGKWVDENGQVVPPPPGAASAPSRGSAPRPGGDT